MDNEKRLTILISIILILTLLNLSATINVYNKITTVEKLNSTKEYVVGQVQSAPTNVPQPSRVNVSTDGDPVLGSKDAPVTIIEFSDFQCPFCEQFFTQTLPQIKKNYIQTGKIKFVYRDYPLDFHQYANKAAQAAKCGDEQGKFWEFHDKIFENQNSLNNESLKQFAKELGLNTSEFNNCLDSGKMAQNVLKDFQDGNSYGVTGTPTFFINGKKLVGTQPYEVIQQVIEEELNPNNLIKK
jgi:protein-disulfide isomerase